MTLRLVLFRVAGPSVSGSSHCEESRVSSWYLSDAVMFQVVQCFHFLCVLCYASLQCLKIHPSLRQTIRFKAV